MKDLALSALTFAALAAVNLVTGVLAARLLGPDGRGELAAIMLWPQMVAAFGVALAVDAVVHAMAKHEESPGRIFASGQALGLALAVPLTLLAGAASFAFNGHFRPEVQDAGLLYALLVPLVLAASLANGQFQGAARFGTWNAMRLFAALAYAGFMLAVWAAGWISVTTLAAASLAGSALTLAALLALLARARWIGWRADRALMRRFLAYCLPIAMGSAIVVVGERLDQIALSQTQSEADFGLYVVAAALGGATNGFAGLIGALALPKIAGAPDAASRVDMFGRFVRLSLALGATTAFALVLLAPWALLVLYGTAFVEAAPIVRILALAAVPLGLKQILVQGAKAHDQTAHLTRIEIVTVAVGGAALLILVPVHGIAGAAWAFVLSQGAGAATALAYTRARLDIPLARLLTPRADDWRRARAAFRAPRS